ncbi:MAG: CHRD domain-containing protein [Candidatus Manganitrophus sp. SB1]|nr:CHRD domain-containing protein [Candidatus Manganitrophus morganii]
MLSFKFKFPFTSILTGLFVALFLIGCGQTGDRQTTIGPGAADNFSSPIPAPLEKLRTGLNAKVIVDGGTPNVQIIDLQVDTQNDRVVGTIPNLPVGPHTFEIQYFIDNALIATAPAVTITIQANADTPVPFDAGALVYPDTDNDGFTNLNEVEIFGSASDAWTNPNLKPEVSVVVNPQTAILPPNGVQTFTAAIAQNANQGVTWNVEGGDANGTITPGGTYTAPVTPGTHNVVATSQADPTKSTTIAVAVVKPATIDPTFDSDGIVSTPLGSSSSITGLAVQTDGKIIAVGQSNLSGSHFTLVRYNPDGSPDTTFGTNNDGIVTTTIGASSIARNVALQTDGKIVVGGDSANQFALARYNSDGTRDSTFGNDGIVTTTIGSSSFGLDLVIQADGKIILAGQTNPVGGGAVTFALARFNTNGSPDTTFDTDGIVTAPAGEVRAVALQADGKIIVAGRSANHFTLVRYNANGTLDTTFDTDGIVTTIIGTTNSIILDLIIQPNGKIVALGQSNSGGVTTVALTRYNENGSLDNTFSTDGIVTTAIAVSTLSYQAVALQADGKILAGGNLSLARFNIDGTLDNTFDTDGILAITIGTGILAFDMDLQADGKVIVGGQLSSHFTLGRFQTAAPSVLLRANLTGDQEIQTTPVTTSATGSATFIISPGQTEITYTLSVSDLGFREITAVQIHLASRGQGGGAVLSTLTASSFISPLTGRLTPSDLEPSARLVAGIGTFSDLIKAMREGRTYVHVHTAFHQLGEIRGQIETPPPTLAALQAQIFTPKCASCHNPAEVGGVTANLFLDSQQTSFENLVNAASTQSPTFKRVEPFKPDESYLIHKLEGTAAAPFNTQMPLGGPFLSAEEIKLTRDWISGGAKND